MYFKSIFYNTILCELYYQYVNTFTQVLLIRLTIIICIILNRFKSEINNFNFNISYLFIIQFKKLEIYLTRVL